VQLHPHATLPPKTRILLVHRVQKHGWPVAKAARAAGVSRQTVHKWLNLFKEGGTESLEDRSCRPRSLPKLTPRKLVRRMVQLRWRRKAGWEIARELNIPVSTVSKHLKREGGARTHHKGARLRTRACQRHPRERGSVLALCGEPRGWRDPAARPRGGDRRQTRTAGKCDAACAGIGSGLLDARRRHGDRRDPPRRWWLPHACVSAACREPELDARCPNVAGVCGLREGACTGRRGAPRRVSVSLRRLRARPRDAGSSTRRRARPGRAPGLRRVGLPRRAPGHRRHDGGSDERGLDGPIRFDDRRKITLSVPCPGPA
jgi:transposase